MLRTLHLKLTIASLAKALVVMALGLACFVGIWVVVAVWRGEADADRAATCVSNQPHLVRAALKYAQDHGGRFPPAGEWCDRLRPYLKDTKAFVCPETKRQRCSYAFNASLSELPLASIRNPVQVVLFFESDRGWNASGGPELLPAKPRHRFGRVDVWAFADGHAKGCSARLLGEMKGPEWWQPRPQVTGKGSRQGRSRGYPGREGAPPLPR